MSNAKAAFPEALASLLGPDAAGLSATTVTRLKSHWVDEYGEWSKRSLEGKQYVYVWADGIHFNIRLEEDRQCILVLMGATPEGKKELIAIHDGHRESEQSWKELLVDCKSRGEQKGMGVFSEKDSRPLSLPFVFLFYSQGIPRLHHRHPSARSIRLARRGFRSA